jgi:hypothetical protein
VVKKKLAVAYVLPLVLAVMVLALFSFSGEDSDMLTGAVSTHADNSDEVTQSSGGFFSNLLGMFSSEESSIDSSTATIQESEQSSSTTSLATSESTGFFSSILNTASSFFGIMGDNPPIIATSFDVQFAEALPVESFEESSIGGIPGSIVNGDMNYYHFNGTSTGSAESSVVTTESPDSSDSFVTIISSVIVTPPDIFWVGPSDSSCNIVHEGGGNYHLAYKNVTSESSFTITPGNPFYLMFVYDFTENLGVCAIDLDPNDEPDHMVILPQNDPGFLDISFGVSVDSADETVDVIVGRWEYDSDAAPGGGEEPGSSLSSFNWDFSSSIDPNIFLIDDQGGWSGTHTDTFTVSGIANSGAISSLITNDNPDYLQNWNSQITISQFNPTISSGRMGQCCRRIFLYLFC